MTGAVKNGIEGAANGSTRTPVGRYHDWHSLILQVVYAKTIEIAALELVGNLLLAANSLDVMKTLTTGSFVRGILK